MSDRRTILLLAVLGILGVVVALFLLDARTNEDVDQLGALTVQAGGEQVEATLVAIEPCERATPDSDCVTLDLPVVREPGAAAPPTDGLALSSGDEVIVDAGGPARTVTAYLGRYVRPADEPLGGDGGTGVEFTRVEADPVEETPRRWSFIVPSLSPRADILVLRVDHASSVSPPLTTAAGEPGEGRLLIAYYEVPIRAATAP